jgi:hypothetical protein
MAKEDDYRRNAAKTIALAQRAHTSRDKRRLLAMAEAWLDLADRAHRIAREHVGHVRQLHPLLRARFGDDRQELE